jgi:hypothetical protein
MKEEMAAHKRAEQEQREHPRAEGELRELREQVQKLSHAVEELRGQLKRAPGDEVRKPEKP